MMTRYIALFVLPLLLLSCTVPERFDSAAEINEQCAVEMQAARTAVRLRDKGKHRQWLQAQLAPVTDESSRLLKIMYLILDESYEFDQLNEQVYPVYRFEVCTRQLTGKSHPRHLSVVYQPLRSCQQTADPSPEAITRCVIAAIDGLGKDDIVKTSN